MSTPDDHDFRQREHRLPDLTDSSPESLGSKDLIDASSYISWPRGLWKEIVKAILIGFMVFVGNPVLVHFLFEPFYQQQVFAQKASQEVEQRRIARFVVMHLSPGIVLLLVELASGLLLLIWVYPYYWRFCRLNGRKLLSPWKEQ